MRRRGPDLAALRALGMTRAQVRGIVLTLAAVLAAAGAPLGLAAGRVLWREVAENTPVQYLPPAAVVALVLAAPLSLALAWLLAALPSHRAATMDLGRASGRSRQAPEAAACAAARTARTGAGSEA